VESEAEAEEEEEEEEAEAEAVAAASSAASLSSLSLWMNWTNLTKSPYLFETQFESDRKTTQRQQNH
jgi:hypothetical protein